MEAAVATITVSALGVYWMHMQKSKRTKNKDTTSSTSETTTTNTSMKATRPRRMSFTSAAIAMGCFPDEVNFSEPIIHALVSFKDINDCPEEEAIVPLVERLIDEVERMAGIPKRYGGSSEWHIERCPKIDPTKMIRTFDVHHDCIDGMADEVQNLRNNYQLESEDRNLPWWEFCLIRNRGKSESMLVWRVHHVIGDGLSLGRVCSKIITRTDGTPVDGDLIPASMRSGKKMERQGSFGKMVLNSIAAAIEIAVSPYMRTDHGIVFAKNVVGVRKDTHNRKTIIFDQYPLDYVKEIKNNANATLNEILNTALSQAIHDFCHHSDCPIIKKHGEKIRCRAFTLIGFPSEIHLDINDACHNGWCPLSLDLGVGHKSLQARLMHIKKRSTQFKERPLASCQMALQNRILPWLPLWLYRKIVQKIFAGHALSCSSVPGPDRPILVAGKPVSACRFAIGHIHSVVGILSYNGQVNITLTADDEAIPDVHLLPKFYTKALVDLGNEFNVEIPQSLKDCV